MPAKKPSKPATQKAPAAGKPKKTKKTSRGK
jgi:hypothetical protein